MHSFLATPLFYDAHFGFMAESPSINFVIIFIPYRTLGTIPAKGSPLLLNVLPCITDSAHTWAI